MHCEIKGWKFLWCTCVIYLMKIYGLYIYIYINIYIYIYIYVCLTVSSPYLLVVGDDRVRGTREQKILQVDLVMHKVGAGLVWDKDFHRSFCIFMIFNEL